MMKKPALLALFPVCGALLFFACTMDPESPLNSISLSGVSTQVASVEVPENGTIVVTLSENPGRTPGADDFSFTQNLSGEEEWTPIEGISLVSWDPATLTAVFGFDSFPYMSDEPVRTIRVKSKSQAAAHAKTVQFIVVQLQEPEPVPVIIDTVEAQNGTPEFPVGTIVITLNRHPTGKKVSAADFSIKKQVDGGAAEDIVGLIWDSYSRTDKEARFRFTQMGNQNDSPISVVIGVTVVETEQEALSLAFTVAAWASEGTAPQELDTQALTDIIDDAGIALAGVRISANGTDVITTRYWVTQAEADAFRAQIDAAQSAGQNGITQADIDAAVAALAGHITTFNTLQKSGTKPPPDKTDLTNAITTATTLKNDTRTSASGNDIDANLYWVTQTVMNTYTAAIAAAQTCKDNEDALEGDIGAATAALEAATAVFTTARQAGTKPPPPNKKPLEDAMNAAEALRNATTIAVSGVLVPSTDYWVTQAVRDAFHAAITTAHNSNTVGWYATTQEALDNAVVVLLAAQETFLAARQLGSMIPDDGTNPLGVPPGKVLKPGYVTITAAAACCTHPTDGAGISALFDGNTNTYWHNDWSQSASAAHPESANHWITLDLGAGFSGEIGQVEYWPRNGNGRIYRTAVYVSNDPLGDVPPESALVKAYGPWTYPTNSTRYINFPAGVSGRYIQVRWLEGQGGVASAMEFKVRELKYEPAGVLPLTFPSPLDDLDLNISPIDAKGSDWHGSDTPAKLIDKNESSGMWDFAWGSGDLNVAHTDFPNELTTTSEYRSGHATALGAPAHFVSFDFGEVVENIYELGWLPRDGNGDFWAYEVWIDDAPLGINPATDGSDAQKIVDVTYAESNSDPDKRIVGADWKFIPLAAPVSTRYLQFRITQDKNAAATGTREFQAAGKEFKVNALGSNGTFTMSTTALNDTLTGQGLTTALNNLANGDLTALNNKVATANGYISAIEEITDTIAKIAHQKLMDAITVEIRQIIMAIREPAGGIPCIAALPASTTG